MPLIEKLVLRYCISYFVFAPAAITNSPNWYRSH